ncbi:unnamed protein product [Protopolystoma xenopodis]|uniref:Uncharacterized protein n=1 Tax=Protopolystoma xenopodis TaxID=117903 RepID=A0A3S5CQB7_9PLAT|nr:unnamed protein product [Protopolystoma xenopodis]
MGQIGSRDNRSSQDLLCGEASPSATLAAEAADASAALATTPGPVALVTRKKQPRVQASMVQPIASAGRPATLVCDSSSPRFSPSFQNHSVLCLGGRSDKHVVEPFGQRKLSEVDLSRP